MYVVCASLEDGGKRKSFSIHNLFAEGRGEVGFRESRRGDIVYYIIKFAASTAA